MFDYDAVHSVARDETHVKSGHANLLRAIIRDTRLHRTAMSIALLAWLVSAGAAETLYTPDVHEIANDLETSPDSVYKGLKRLTDWGYVERAQIKSQRLLMRLVWPKTKPTKRRTNHSKRG